MSTLDKMTINNLIGILDSILYRVTHQVEPNLPLKSKQKFCFGLSRSGQARPKQNFCFDVKGRYHAIRYLTELPSDEGEAVGALLQVGR